MLYNFCYKLDEISSIFSTPQFTTLVLYSVQLYVQMYSTLYCIVLVYLYVQLYTLYSNIHLYLARSVHRGPGATFLHLL